MEAFACKNFSTCQENSINGIKGGRGSELGEGREYDQNILYEIKKMRNEKSRKKDE